MDETPLIRVENLTAGYGRDVILKDVSFTVSPGEIFGVIGGSGSGKSTLLKTMIGLERAMSGRVFIAGSDVSSFGGAVFFPAMKKIGVLFQGGALISSMTIAENVALPIYEHSDLPKKHAPDMARMKLRMVGLEGFEDFFPSQLSGGMRKRAALARAMALSPDILFLDEPTAGLDPVSAAEIDALIRRVNHLMGTTVVMITHDLDSVFSMARRAAMLDKKKKGFIARGDPKELMSRRDPPEVARFFNRKQGSGEN
ncbi:Polyamine ABC transporter ATP-binding protein [Candidatus Desulfarcum epimagneticum]|uniref:Polyamine ABC transporter ATP-binding protein n=1 Tax=uncultured Desulfobacteraceae bacterium TaxID=218296 RepID=A0A484HI04_9BACT|nr:Polyamine ABC transporter ATP-binding protein [uncultured Desulfobacteraceae bacterium]